VTVEGLPEVSFTHTSPMQCWDSVRDRVNEEIAKQISFGKSGLPDFLSCNSLNGLEMFGFLSSPIIKEIEALDPCHQCLDYWLSRVSSVGTELPSESVMAAMVNDSTNPPIKLLGIEINRRESEQSSSFNNSCVRRSHLAGC
jgi:hypothetical protein